MNTRILEIIKWIIVLALLALFMVVGSKFMENLGGYIWTQFKGRVLGVAETAKKEGSD